MEIKSDVSENFPLIYPMKCDSSMFFFQSKQEQQRHPYDLNLSKQTDEIIMNETKKRVKKTVTFPFGKW